MRLQGQVDSLAPKTWQRDRGASWAGRQAGRRASSTKVESKAALKDKPPSKTGHLLLRRGCAQAQPRIEVVPRLHRQNAPRLRLEALAQALPRPAVERVDGVHDGTQGAAAGAGNQVQEGGVELEQPAADLYPMEGQEGCNSAKSMGAARFAPNNLTARAARRFLHCRFQGVMRGPLCKAGKAYMYMEPAQQAAPSQS